MPTGGAQPVVRRAKAEPVSPPPAPPPTAAPHLADRLLVQESEGAVIRTTIDAVLQRRWQELARTWARSLGPAVSVAVLAVKNQDRDVVAYIGSADFGDATRAGHVDVVPALRSPGSALKPVLYALAFERGIAHPATLVDDIPTQFGDYAPSNFMDRHYGRVTLSEALQRSLNVPAVALLDRLGPVAWSSACVGPASPLPSVTRRRRRAWPLPWAGWVPAWRI